MNTHVNITIILFAACLFVTSCAGSRGTSRVTVLQISQQELLQDSTQIVGYIRDQETGYPIYGHVVVIGTIFRAETEMNGYYKIPNVPPGEYIIQATSMAYFRYQCKITLNLHQALHVDFELAEGMVKMR